MSARESPFIKENLLALSSGIIVLSSSTYDIGEIITEYGYYLIMCLYRGIMCFIIYTLSWSSTTYSYNAILVVWIKVFPVATKCSIIFYIYFDESNIFLYLKPDQSNEQIYVFS